MSILPDVQVGGQSDFFLVFNVGIGIQGNGSLVSDAPHIHNNMRWIFVHQPSPNICDHDQFGMRAASYQLFGLIRQGDFFLGLGIHNRNGSHIDYLAYRTPQLENMHRLPHTQ